MTTNETNPATRVRYVDANPNGLIKPTDLLSLSQEDAERMIRSAYSGDRGWKDGRKSGDLRVGAALVSMRLSYGLPRSTVANLSGVSLTTITRSEIGVRSLSADALTNILVGVREGIKILHPGRKAEYDKWMIDFLYLVADVERESRAKRSAKRLRNFKKEEKEEAVRDLFRDVRR